MAQQQRAEEAIAMYRAWALDPSGLAPPGVDPAPQEASAPGVRGTAAVVMAEEQPWNQWGEDGDPLLFNDRVALLFELDLEVEGEGAWLADATVLEVNDPEQRVRAAPSPEDILGELVWHALQQEKWVLDGDLVQRTRHAGGFRDAFVRMEDGHLRGLVAFPRGETPQDVAALRLTVAVLVDGELQKLEWVFQ